MKTVVLGAGGMLGHVVAIYLKEKYHDRVILSARQKTGILLIDQDIQKADLSDWAAVEALLQNNRPCIVVNCAAITDSTTDQSQLGQVNTVLPQRIADRLDEFKDGSRLIHISTDGVFSGNRGQYREDDLPDAQDPYGMSKRLGEVTRSPHLTIRTSFIGPDPVHSRGLMNWFFSQTGQVTGYRRVYWSGVTTLELARFIDCALTQEISGLFHLCGQRVSKYELLSHLKEIFDRRVVIVADDQRVLDRSLITQRRDVHHSVSSASMMLEQLKLWIIQHPGIYSPQ